MLSRRLFSTKQLSLLFTQRRFRTIDHVGVIGAGQMGSGIAYVAAATAKLKVTVMDTQQASIEKAQKYVDKLIAKSISKNQMTEQEGKDIVSRISYTQQMDPIGGADFVIEAATENTDLKLKIFENLSKITEEDVILASNTSSISITKIASATNRPDKVIGMHFMNPVPVMKLVEVINGLQTSKETHTTTLQLAEKMGKVCTVSKDVPGFIANRILMPYINEAIQTLYEGIATVDDINNTMKLGTNVPMGPLTLAEFIGLDTCLAIMRVLYTEFADSKYRPSPLLVKMVEAGWLGVKNGKGFKDYEQNILNRS